MYRVAVVKKADPYPWGNWPYLLKDNRFFVEPLSPRRDAALEQLMRQPADLLLVDLRSHPEEGLSLMRSIRLKDVGVDVIALIPDNNQRIMQQAFQLGAVDCLTETHDVRRMRQALDRFVSRAQLMQTKGRLTQEAIDSILQGVSHKRNTLPKGLQETTLALVRKVFEHCPESGLSCEDVSLAVGLSRITVQRYLSHLCEKGDVVQRVNYHTGGRPCTLYRRLREMEMMKAASMRQII
jgi:response regulator of citrate/malate metabolism